MGRPRLRAFLFAAGFGTRLRPLTGFLPKALLPITGEPVMGHTLRRLAKLGCEAAMINLHHLGEHIPRELGRRYHGMPLLYSPEEEILGTSGGLWAARDFLRGADFGLLINGDALCDWPIAATVRRHRKAQAAVTLLLHRRKSEAALGGGVGIGEGGSIVQIRDFPAHGEVQSRHVFAGLHVLSPKVLDRLPEGPGDILEAFYKPLMEEGLPFQAAFTGKSWHDLGTPSRYLEASLERLPRRLLGFAQGNSLSPLASIADDAQIRKSAIEREAWIGEGAEIERSVVLGGAQIGGASRIRGSIIGPEVVIPPSSEIEGRMVIRIPTGHTPGPEESIMGNLSYTPVSAV